MVLRKPYAFLIKNFRLFHVILTLLLAYSIYRTNLILSFFNEYLHSTEVMIGANVASGLFNFYLFIVPFVVILFSIILLSVLYNKKKPYLFYVFMILVSLFGLGVYNFAYSKVLIIQSNIVDVRTVSLVRDLLIVCLMIFLVYVLLVLIFVNLILLKICKIYKLITRIMRNLKLM